MLWNLDVIERILDHEAASHGYNHGSWFTIGYFNPMADDYICGRQLVLPDHHGSYPRILLAPNHRLDESAGLEAEELATMLDLLSVREVVKALPTLDAKKTLLIDDVMPKQRRDTRK